VEEWTTVRFPEMPDRGTRRAMLSWVEERSSGRVLLFNTTDWLGRRCYGFRFQDAEDARRFEARWLDEGEDDVGQRGELWLAPREDA
jgi:hypothetical protein